MSEPHDAKKPIRKKLAKLGKRRLGLSKHGLVEVVPRDIADAEIAKLFEDGNLFPDGDE